MKDKVGYQVGLASQLPINESGIMNLVVSSLDWQENHGPCVIFVDEGFYRFLLRSRIEIIYHDILPLPTGLSIEEAHQYANAAFPAEIFYIENIYKGQMDRDAINDYMRDIPEEIRDNWKEMLMNEEMILSLSQLNYN